MRSLLKSLSWRFVALSITAFVVYHKTGSFEAAGTIGIADSAFKIWAYWLHDRMWEKKSAQTNLTSEVIL